MAKAATKTAKETTLSLPGKLQIVHVTRPKNVVTIVTDVDDIDVRDGSLLLLRREPSGREACMMVFRPARSTFAGKVIRSSENGPWSPKWMLLLSEYDGLKPPTPLFRGFTSSVNGLGLAVTPGTVARSVPFTLTTTCPPSSPAHAR